MQNFHPQIVHFPIALLTAALAFEVMAALIRKPGLKDAAWWTFVFGFLGLLAAAASGLIAESTVGHTHEAHEWILLHRNLGLFACVLFAVLFVWRLVRRGEMPDGRASAVYYVIMTAAVGMILAGGHLGGKLVYEFGVGTSIGKPEKHHYDTEAEIQTVPHAKSDTAKQEDKLEAHEHKH